MRQERSECGEYQMGCKSITCLFSSEKFLVSCTSIPFRLVAELRIITPTNNVKKAYVTRM